MPFWNFKYPREKKYRTHGSVFPEITDLDRSVTLNYQTFAREKLIKTISFGKQFVRYVIIHYCNVLAELPLVNQF